MAAPARNINGQYVINRVTYPVSNAVSDWYYAAATGDAVTFVGVVDNAVTPTAAAIDAEVASAIYEMGLAASILPLFCLGAAFRRWRRTR